MSGLPRALLRTVAVIDGVNGACGAVLRWGVLLVPCVTAIYAAVRKLTPWGHNGWSEVQWFAYAWVFMAGSGYTLLRDAHVRVDVLAARWSWRVRSRVEIALHLLLWPACAYMAWHFGAFWWASATHADGPEDVLSGLQRWPLKLAFFVGFVLLLAQSVAEVMRRVAWLRGWSPAPGGGRP